MHFFKKSLWVKINDCDATVRLKAEQEWMNNSILYQQHFNKIQHHFSRKFIKDFHLRNGFHDYIMQSIAIEKKGKNYSCQLQLTNEIETILVTMDRLISFNIDAKSFQQCINGNLMWAYSEFEIDNDNNILLSVLCDLQNEMNFQFKSIKIKIL